MRTAGYISLFAKAPLMTFNRPQCGLHCQIVHLTVIDNILALAVTVMKWMAFHVANEH